MSLISARIILRNQLILLAIFLPSLLNAQEVPGTVTFHPVEKKEPILETPFRKPVVTPPEKPVLPKVNSPVVPSAEKEEEKPQEPNRRPPATQRRAVLPPLGLEPDAKPEPKEMPEGRKPVNLIDASPIVFAQSDIAIYPWRPKEEYFEDAPDKVINLKARIMRSDRVVLPDSLSKIKFMDNHGVLTIFSQSQPASIPLEHIYFSQDILFLDDEGIIKQMVYKTEPRSEKSILSKQDVRSVLQLNSGSIQRYNLKIGDKVAIPAS